MKLLFWFFAISLSSALPATSQQDAKADALIQDMIQFGRSIDGFEARFTYQTFGPNQSGQVQEGLIQIYHGGKYIIQIPGQLIFMNGTTQWVYLPERNEVFIDNYVPGTGNVMNKIYGLFSLPTQRSYLGQEMCEGKVCDKILMRMKSNQTDFREAYVWMQPNPRMVYQATFIDVWETTTTYGFHQIRLNVSLQEADFTFRPADYPGIKIHDNR